MGRRWAVSLTLHRIPGKVLSGTSESGRISPCPFIRGGTGAEVPFYKIFIGNFMVYQDRIETNLLQPFAHPEISERFSIISCIIFEVNIVAEP